MQKKIWNIQIFSNFSKFLHRIWLLYPKLANFEDIQLGIIAYNFGNVVNCQYSKSYTNASENMDSTNICQFFTIFKTEFDCFTLK